MRRLTFFITLPCSPKAHYPRHYWCLPPLLPLSCPGPQARAEASVHKERQVAGQERQRQHLLGTIARAEKAAKEVGRVRLGPPAVTATGKRLQFAVCAHDNPVPHGARSMRCN